MGGYGSGRSGGRATTDSGLTLTLSKLLRDQSFQPGFATSGSLVWTNTTTGERIGARGRYLGGKVPFGFRRGDDGDLVPHEAEQEAIREIVSLRAQGNALRAIAQAVAAKGHKLS
jgi:hypothetical protein